MQPWDSYISAPRFEGQKDQNILWQLLPMLIGGGLAGILGGGVGFGNAMQSYADITMARKRMESKREEDEKERRWKERMAKEEAMRRMMERNRDREDRLEQQRQYKPMNVMRTEEGALVGLGYDGRTGRWTGDIIQQGSAGPKLLKVNTDVRGNSLVVTKIFNDGTTEVEEQPLSQQPEKTSYMNTSSGAIAEVTPGKPPTFHHDPKHKPTTPQQQGVMYTPRGIYDRDARKWIEQFDLVDPIEKQAIQMAKGDWEYQAAMGDPDKEEAVIEKYRKRLRQKRQESVVPAHGSGQGTAAPQPKAPSAFMSKFKTAK